MESDNIEGISQNSDREVSFSAAGHLLVPVLINNVPIQAVIDTAAQVTVVNKKYAKKIIPCLKGGKKIILRGINSEHPVVATLCPDVDITLGKVTYKCDVVVAPISDPCILGLDFITKYQLDIRLSDNMLSVGDENIPIEISEHKPMDAFCVKTVALEQNLVIRPRMGIQFSIEVDYDSLNGSDFYVFEPVEHENLEIFSGLFETGKSLPIAILNPTNRKIVLPKGFKLGAIVDVADPDYVRLVGNITLPEIEIRTLAAEEFPDCYPAKKSPHFTMITDTLPDHVQDLFRRSCKHLTFYQCIELANLISEFSATFSSSDTDLGHFKAVVHRIVTKSDKAIKQQMRRTPLHFEGEEEGHLMKLKDSRVIKDSNSEFAHPVCLVRKRDGSIRWCIDFRKLNDITVRDCFPIPKIEQCIDTLCGSQFFGVLDLAQGYYQIEIAEEDKHKTAFITRYGLFQHERMPFGLCNAPATFQRAMQLVLRGLLFKTCLCYIDDIIICAKTFEEGIHNIRQVLERMRYYNLKLKPKKCAFFQKQLRYLGRLISPDGITVSEEHVKCIREWPIPSTRKQLESFLGFANYHRTFIKDYAALTDSLYKYLVTLGPGRITLTDDHVARIEEIRRCLLNAPVFPYPDPEYTFILDCDASDIAIGCELSQLVDGQERVIAYGSYALTPAQRRYCTTRKELLSIVRFCRLYKHYLLGRSFICRTDHNSLTWLMSFKNLEGQLARWMEELSQYDMKVIHRPGKHHQNADALSRIPDTLEYCPNYQCGIPLSKLPCFRDGKPCLFCERAHNKWEHFEQDVDYVVPLAVRAIQASDNKVPNDIDPNLWLPSYSVKELAELQREDSDLRLIILWLENNIEPTQAELALSSPAVRHYWLLKSQLRLHQSVLFYTWEDALQSKLLLLVPVALHEEVMELCHDVKSSAHVGQQNTYLNVKASFYWHGLRADCTRFVATCASCNKNKHAKRQRRSELGQYHAGAPMDRVMIDVLGPLSKTPRGNTVILMMIDQFTKWVECIPLPNQSTEVVAKAVIDEFFSRFGCPLEIHTDQGRNFTGNLFVSLAELLQITKTRTTAYRPRSNGQIERINRTLLQMIRCVSDKNLRNWDLHIPQLCGAMRSTVNRSTGFTPNKLMLGREVLKPVDLVFGIGESNFEASSPEDYLSNLSQIMRTCHDVARSQLKSSIAVNKRDYDLKMYQRAYNRGDLVYLLHPQIKSGVSRKLQPIYKGPFLVVAVLSPVLYRIRDRRGDKVVHHDRLQICDDRFVPLWMRKMRHQFLELDETIAYDASEGEDSQLVEPVAAVADLFSEDDTNAGREGSDPLPSGDIVIDPEDNLHLPLDDVSEEHDQTVDEPEDPIEEPEVDSSMPTESIASNEEQPTETRTRRGRAVKPSAWFRDYITDY